MVLCLDGNAEKYFLVVKRKDRYNQSMDEDKKTFLNPYLQS
jgi:hypothetical protein